MESTVMEQTAMGKRFFAGRTVRVAALLLLFGLAGASGSVARPWRRSRQSFGTRRDGWGQFRRSSPEVSRFERLFGLTGLTTVGRVADGIFRGAPAGTRRIRHPEGDGHKGR